MNLKQPKIRSEKHRRFVASLPCLVCRSPYTQAAHIRMNNGGGKGLKPGDNHCIPLCVGCHEEQHHHGERRFWGNNISLANFVSQELYRVTGNKRAALEIIAGYK